MKDNEKIKDLWWRPAMFIAINVSGWIAGPIILALIIGKYLDKKYDSAPWFFLGLTGVAFIVSIGGIWKILNKYIKDLEKEARKKKESTENKENKFN